MFSVNSCIFSNINTNFQIRSTIDGEIGEHRGRLPILDQPLEWTTKITEMNGPPVGWLFLISKRGGCFPGPNRIDDPVVLTTLAQYKGCKPYFLEMSVAGLT